jgi:signal transduction histidine kinase
VRFIASGGVYQFDRKKLDNLAIKDYQLPPRSNIINTTDPRIEKYKRYIYGISGITFILIILIITFSILYGRNKRLRKRLEENSKLLQEAKERAEESDRLKSAFLANMSHEIRTPLNAIVGFSNLLTEEEFSGQERKDMSSVITQNSKLLLTLITDILDFSGLETGKLNFVFKETDLNAICEQVLATISHLRKDDVEYRFEPGMKDIIIRTDSHRLSQVLLNLLTNANKFTDRGSIILKYEVVTKDKGYLLFSVTDTGTGIPKEQHKLLFERFGKLNNFKQGAGLGLAISKQIIARLGGKIWIDSGYTDGARFFFTHPL